MSITRPPVQAGFRCSYGLAAAVVLPRFGSGPSRICASLMSWWYPGAGQHPHSYNWAVILEAVALAVRNHCWSPPAGLLWTWRWRGDDGLLGREDLLAWHFPSCFSSVTFHRSKPLAQGSARHFVRVLHWGEVRLPWEKIRCTQRCIDQQLLCKENCGLLFLSA